MIRKNVLIQTIFIFAFIQLSYSKTEFCRVLALQGGGDKGSYQAGAIQGLIDNLPAEDVEWDVVSGISVGSINSFALSLFEKGSEKEAINYMIKLWEEIKGPSDIYENWNAFGIAYGLFFKKGIWNNAPLKNYIQKSTISYPTIKRDLVIGATSVLNGKYRRFQNFTSKAEALEAVMASSAYPGAFPPNDINGDLYSDGGISYSIDVSAAIEICKAKGYEENKITIDVVMCNRNEIKWQKKVFSYQVIFEALTLMMHEFRLRDVEQIAKAYPDTKFRYFVEPSKEIGDLLPLTFDPKELRARIALGNKDAKDIIGKGEGTYFKEMIVKISREDISLPTHLRGVN